MEHIQPRTFVELGTHFGLSYFAMCQLVEGAGLPTSYNAIDTWQGDSHAGFYEETVYRGVVDANRRYARFSELIRATFDQAVGLFAEGLIDLLHIGGRHGYEDVKHDFDTWRPKLSHRGFVLFHDATVRDRDFGVWCFFDELRGAYPSSNSCMGMASASWQSTKCLRH